MRKRCQTEDKISDAESEAFLRFSDRLELLGSQYTNRRLEFHLMRLVNIAQSVGGLADALEEIRRGLDVVSSGFDFDESLRRSESNL